MNTDVVIVGGGLAGLSCALTLKEDGIEAQIVEASDEVGGRVRTDRLGGFLLDPGFQVLLSAYPAAQRLLDYESLKLRAFTPGAMVRHNGRFEALTDPRRRPLQLMTTLTSDVGSLRDKLQTASLGVPLLAKSVEDIFRKPESSTGDLLRRLKFSDAMLERFFRPFYGGIFLERELRTSSRMFEFTFKMFASGDTCVPAEGMGAIPRQMAARLAEGSVRLNSRVQSIEGRRIRLSSGEELNAHSVVIANGRMKVTDEGAQANGFHGWRGTTCLYFAATHSPVESPTLVLNGQGYGPVNHLAVMSDVAPSYAPAGAALISASVMGVPIQSDEELEAQVRAQLMQWFGPKVSGWRMLKVYRIPQALPEQRSAAGVADQEVRVRPGMYVCGDHLGNASIQGAMESGMKAAMAILEDRAERRVVA
jgi:phytoene dehydrogenase-like protein